MKKYEPLFKFLKDVKASKITLSYLQIEDILLSKLPLSSYKYRQWCNGKDHPELQAEAWFIAGYRTTNVVLGESVVFEKRGVMQWNFC